MTQVIPFNAYATTPDAIEAEQALLGAILIRNDCLRDVEFLKPEHFAEPLHRNLFQTMRTMITDGRAIAPITAKPFLPEMNIGGMSTMQYVARLASEAVTTINAPDYGKGILDTWVRRKLISAAEDLDASARNASADLSPRQIISQIEGQLHELSENLAGQDEPMSLADAADLAIGATSSAYKFQKRLGIETGIEAVSQLIGPMEPGQLVIVGGGTKQGKTALSMQMVAGIATQGPVWVYSGEMSPTTLAMREIARRTGIPVSSQREGRISQQDWVKIEQCRGEVGKLPIFIEKRRLTLERIYAAAADIQRKHALAAILIDHIGHIRFEGYAAGKPEWERSQLATIGLKEIADRLGIVVIAAVQLKKNTFALDGARGFSDKVHHILTNRPSYADLMGAVERDADHVLMPFQARPLLAQIEPDPKTDDYLHWESLMSQYANKAEIILALSREQEFPARRDVIWSGKTTSFERWQTQPSLLG